MPHNALAIAFPLAGTKAGRAVATALIALAVFGLLLAAAGKDPFQAYLDTLAYVFGNAYGFSELLVRMVPLMLTATAVALPARIGLINVGGEGQLYMGALFATGGAIAFPEQPSFVLLPLITILGFIGGGLWALLPGLLRAAKLVNETISTLLLNYVAPLIVSYLIFGPWRSAESAAYPEFDRVQRRSKAASLLSYTHSRWTTLRHHLPRALLVLHGEVPLGIGNAGNRRKSGSCAATWHSGLSIHRRRNGYRRRCRGSCGHVGGFRHPGPSGYGALPRIWLRGFPRRLARRHERMGDRVHVVPLRDHRLCRRYPAVHARGAVCGHQCLDGDRALHRIGSATIEEGAKMTAALLAGVVSSAILSAVSLVYAGLGELVSERAGIVNLGVEGLMLIGLRLALPQPRSPAALTLE